MRVFESKTLCRGCQPSFRDCSHTSSSYSEQMKQFWWYTKDRYLCNEFMHNMYFADISDPNMNPKCIYQENSAIGFATPGQHNPAQIGVSKTSTERCAAQSSVMKCLICQFCVPDCSAAQICLNRFKIHFLGVTGPFGQVCMRSAAGGDTIDQGHLH